jgi:hypothetical protein
MNDGIGVVAIVLSVLFLLGGGLYGCPQYMVYSARLSGEATFAEAESARQVTVRQAQADLDSSKLRAQAEVERAKGAAEANKIIAEGLGGPEGYLRYLFIQAMENRKGDTIYIPTEAGLPILEARPRAGR